jgi:hypothetical protein
MASVRNTWLMRTAALLGVCATAAAVVLGFTILGGSGSKASGARPSIRLIHAAPLTVRGEHFRSGERVRVTAAAKSAQTKANGDGIFVVTVHGATRCETLRILARGSAGSYVIVKLLPQPACLPSRSS